jgi:hypothetical protein
MKFTWVFALALLPMVGCIFDPPRDPPKPPDTTPYPILSTPENVLVAMRMAYQRRDSVEYASLFDSSYVGLSVDQANPGGTLRLDFTRDDEQHHMGRLNRRTSIISCDFDLGPGFIRFTDVNDAPWATIQTTTATLEINDSPNAYILVSSNETIEFKFKPKTPAPSSTTDTTWQIIKWTEIHQ